MQIILANPRGFCAGVDRAIEIVERAIQTLGAPIYVRHEVVHNTYVVNDLKNKGAIFVEELDEVPDHATVIFSAHGVAQAIHHEAKRRALKVFDATCPLVTKVHLEVIKHARQGDDVILIGHAGHPEVEGTMGQYDRTAGGDIFLIESEKDIASLKIKNPDKLAFVTQTTLSVDDTINIIRALQKKFPSIQSPRKDDICYATQNRQDAVKKLSEICDLILVVGSKNSSNSNRLKELANNRGIDSYLIDNVDHIKNEWLANKNTVGITAGASAPEILVRDIIKYLQQKFGATLSPDSGPKENVIFQLPRELRT
ncbi:MAG TPA: 4-hydroxy-3-methylbut-2-enyl diphosphate reductase [Gammaproteobacteria bacterium]|nr:4-hydroxy-3-methylbut-2-enyl diphosphate reductase [Gammaproteobacteria bacterium]